MPADTAGSAGKCCSGRLQRQKKTVTQLELPAAEIGLILHPVALIQYALLFLFKAINLTSVSDIWMYANATSFNGHFQYLKVVTVQR